MLRSLKRGVVFTVNEVGAVITVFAVIKVAIVIGLLSTCSQCIFGQSPSNEMSMNSNAYGAAQNTKKSTQQKPRKGPFSEVSLSAPTPPYVGSPVKPASRQELVDYAARLDQAIERMLNRQGMAPNQDSDHATFVRRVYLDTVGRIPSIDEFESSLMKLKRAESPREARLDLIDELLGSPDAVSHQYNFWASLLRLVDFPRNNIYLLPYQEWIKEQVANNRPYDEMVYEMLTATGKVWEEPAAGYTLRDFGMPLVHVDNTVRVFLGTQVGCAQCHDHPFDKWTQKDFYELAAFTNSVITRDNNQSDTFKKGNPLQKLRKKLVNVEDRKRNGIVQLGNANLFRVTEQEGRKLRFPDDYAYDNAQPKQLVQPKLLWGEVPADAASQSLREQYASWIVSPENPRFAKTIVNRLWKNTFGRGLIEPVDDFTDDSDGPYDPLLDQLAGLFVKMDFDIQEFQRLLLYTNTYHRECGNFDPNLETDYWFAGPMMRRFSAEQIWDSILALSVSNPYPYTKPGKNEYQQFANLDLASIGPEDALKKFDRFNEELNRGKLNRSWREFSYRGQVLARASELPQPAPPNHFLRQFGQSDREVIDANSIDASAPQALAMMNGNITQMVLEKDSVLTQRIMSAEDPADAMRVVFLSVLQREPTRGEIGIIQKEAKESGTRQAVMNVIWALLNTREFVFYR